MSKTLKVGVVGCGFIANQKHLPNLYRLNNVKIVAFCDIVVEKAEKAAKEFGIEDAKVFKDYKELIKEDLDIVHVLTPNYLHAAITIAALDAGAHVMCEKPMAITGKEARQMLDAAIRNDKKLTVGYQSRHRDESRYLKKLINLGELGDIYYAKAYAVRRRGVPTWGVFIDEEKQGGGPIIDIGTHSLDVTLWLMDNYEWESVVGTTFKKLGNRKNAANSGGSWDPEKFTVEDSGFGFIKFKNGDALYLEASWAINMMVPGKTSVLVGTKGGAELLNGGLQLNSEKEGRLYTAKPTFDAGTESVRDEDGNFGLEELSPMEITFAREIKAWINSVANDTELVTKPEQAMVVTEILEAIYKSANTGKPVFNE